MQIRSGHFLGTMVVMASQLLLAPNELRADSTESADTGESVARYLARQRNYRKVKRDVLKWHKTMRNGCVAFASTALRHVGVAVPQDGVLDGHGISRITLAFSRYLVERLSWQRIDDPTRLKPGDLVFTEDAPCCPGYPDHVFVFLGWKSKRHQIAQVSDNQGFTHARALFPKSGTFTPFAYALRAP